MAKCSGRSLLIDTWIGICNLYDEIVKLADQPVGQIAYGFLFDWFHEAVYLVLVPTGIMVCVIGRRNGTMNFWEANASGICR